MAVQPVTQVTVCAHCGQPQAGSATVQRHPVCHPSDPGLPDCYRRITVYGERLSALYGAWPLPAGCATIRPTAGRA